MWTFTAAKIVSIPQSGFGAFELDVGVGEETGVGPFQSLSRDSGRLNEVGNLVGVKVLDVSIPQSGFGAFEREKQKGQGHPGPGVSIPQSGFGAFELAVTIRKHRLVARFQSLSRDSGRLNYGSDFGSDQGHPRFNPSVGIRGV
mgnify:CR=1 FL=1